MKKVLYPITFAINKNNEIIIPLQYPIKSLDSTYEEIVLLSHYNHEIILSDRTIYHDMLDLADILKKAFNNELLLHPSITKDIGYHYNNYHYNDANFSMHVFPSGTILWVGYLYHLWESTHHFDSWIYNSSDGSIIFEVTPFYPYMYCEPKQEPDYIPYNEWIKTYKPYFITTLSRETAEQWLRQAQDIIKVIENNQKRWELQSQIDGES